jgi:hypothetical protein
MRDYGEVKENTVDLGLTFEDGVLNPDVCRQNLINHANDNPTVFKVVVYKSYLIQFSPPLSWNGPSMII